MEDTLNTIEMCNLQLFTMLMPTCAKINHVLFLFPNGNKTQISEFILLGFSEEPALQPLLFGLFLSLYLITVVGNLLIILAVISDSHVHTPMYFFLSNLSFVDICFISTTIPKMLVNIQTQSKVISYEDCFTQIYFFLLFVQLDDFLLTVMSYDRYVAICHPLHYTVIMNAWLCALLVLVSWMIGALNSLLQTSLALCLSFCTVLEIPHFFCEFEEVIQLACSDASLNKTMMYFAVGLLGGGPFAGICYSYSRIVSSIHRISSAQGKYKAFSTCASHVSGCLLILLYSLRSVLYPCCYPQFTFKCNSLGDVHCGHTRAEPLHLQSEE